MLRVEFVRLQGTLTAAIIHYAGLAGQRRLAGQEGTHRRLAMSSASVDSVSVNTFSPSPAPSPMPTMAPTPIPSHAPTLQPAQSLTTTTPTATPTQGLTSQPTQSPTVAPTSAPTRILDEPSGSPVAGPTAVLMMVPAPTTQAPLADGPAAEDADDLALLTSAELATATISTMSIVVGAFAFVASVFLLHA